MRTTIDLPDALYREAKAASALRGMSLKELITAAVERILAEESPREAYEVQLPLIRTGKPGTLELTNAQIEDLLA